MGEEEKVYIGTKVIAAKPMDEFEFKALKKEPLVGPNRRGYRVRYEDGYLSWSPKETFERAYRLVTDKETGLIIENLPGWPPADLPSGIPNTGGKPE